MKNQKIGVLAGSERSWPPAFMAEVNRQQAGVTAELVKIGGTHVAQPCEYRVIVDRISYEVPYYRTFLKTALLDGTTVINNPLWASAYDRFFNASLITRMGFHHPRMVALPCYAHHEGLNDDALRNLIAPIPWEEHLTYLGGFPLVLRPVHDSGLKWVSILESYDDLCRAYARTGTEPMMLREHIAWDKYVRCMCIGPDHILPIKYSPGAAWSMRYHLDDTYLTAEERNLVIDSAIQINHALGFDVNAIDFALRDGKLYVVDVTNPVPDFDVSTLSPHLFDWVVKTMADYTINLALGQRLQSHEFRWSRQIQPRRHVSCHTRNAPGLLRLHTAPGRLLEQER